MPVRPRPSRNKPLPVPADPNAVTPARRDETLPVGLAAMMAGILALAIAAKLGVMLLYGDAVAHLGIARRIVDTNTPGLANLGGVWLPLPHLLMLPFIGRMEWWQNGMAGAWPSLVCFIAAVMGLYRLARRMLPPRWALAAAAFFGLNANLLYLATTAMTEPLFLALFVWIILLTYELVDGFAADKTGMVQSRLIWLGLLNLCATMTRYDGWILAAAVWCIAAWQIYSHPAARRAVGVTFAGFTLLSVAGPGFWFWYNHAYGHDWLDFLRGPYSAKEIDRKTSPPGAHKYWGWHNPAWSLMLYARTAQVDAAWWETGWVLAAGALWASWKAWQARVNRAWLLLWLPLPFYVYSISYGSVPIFIPQLYPHSFYNSRYGMELLPLLAVLPMYALWQLARRHALWMRVGPPAAMMLVVVNTVLMLHATPLVLKEAEVNSRGRLALEQPLAQQLQLFHPGARILMQAAEYVGALQTAGIPLRNTVGPDDYYGWRAGLADPAKAAQYAVANDGSVLEQAVKAHPGSMTELMIVCTMKQPCVHLYESNEGPAR